MKINDRKQEGGAERNLSTSGKVVKWENPYAKKDFSRNVWKIPKKFLAQLLIY
jgi:hypothetical protein